MKLFAKIVLGILAYNTVRNGYNQKDSLTVGTRTNMARSEIPNNGGR